MTRRRVPTLKAIDKEENTMQLNFDQMDEMEDPEEHLVIKNVSRKQRRAEKISRAKKAGDSPKASTGVRQDGLQALSDEENGFRFSYKASRHEAQWIADSLGKFYQQHWFADVLRLVKGGKEASVYLCQASPTAGAEYIAAKVYRPRKFRNLKNDALYREGRNRLDADGNVITDDGMLHAIQKRSRFGLELMHTSWIEHEYRTMEVLAEAGADVPAVFARGDNAILMEYIGDLDGPAPALNEVDLEQDEAQALFARVMGNIEIMLGCDRVHGDLSAYNILYWEGEITLIDFPQAINPHENHNAFRIFERDVTRVCEYFASQGVASEPKRIAAEMWAAHHHHIAPVVEPLYLDAEKAADRLYWERVQRQER